MNRRLVLAVAIAAAAVALLITCDVLVLVHHLRHWPHGYAYWLEGTVSLPVWVAIGLLVTIRVPGNPIGWVALGASLCSGVQLSSGAIATQLAGTGSTSAAVNWLAAVSATAQIGIVGGLMVFGYIAPDGRLVGPRWRPMFFALIAALVVVAVNNVCTDSGVTNEVVVARAPVRGVPSSALHAAMVAANVTVLVALPAGLVGLILRYRRGSALQRLQLKWLLVATSVALFLATVVQAVTTHYWPDVAWIGSVTWVVIGSCLPVGVGVGVLRYRLYDIDRILSRTVSYLVVTGGIAGLYIAVVALTDTVLGFSSSVAVAASTLAAAAMFQPLRHRVQLVVDRRFDRAAYDARRTVEAFSGRLRDEVDADAVRADLLATVATSMAPASASLWVAS